MSWLRARGLGTGLGALAFLHQMAKPPMSLEGERSREVLAQEDDNSPLGDLHPVLARTLSNIRINTAGSDRGTVCSRLINSLLIRALQD